MKNSTRRNERVEWGREHADLREHLRSHRRRRSPRQAGRCPRSGPQPSASPNQPTARSAHPPAAGRPKTSHATRRDQRTVSSGLLRRWACGTPWRPPAIQREGNHRVGRERKFAKPHTKRATENQASRPRLVPAASDSAPTSIRQARASPSPGRPRAPPRTPHGSGSAPETRPAPRAATDQADDEARCMGTPPQRPPR